jgi:hypothetical protein
MHSLHLPSHLARRISKRLLGPDAGIGAIALIGCILGTIIALDPNESLKFFVLLTIPAWFFYVAVCLMMLLRYPRILNLGFVLGITYQTRKSISGRFLSNKSIEMLGIIFFISLSLTIIRAFRFGPDTVQESMGFAGVLAGAAVFLYGILWILEKLSFGGAVHSDPKPWRLFRGSGAQTQRLRALVSINLASRIGSILKKPYSTILKRQVLYLLRYDLFGFLITNMAAVPLALALVWFTRGNNTVAIDIILAAAPLMLFSVMNDGMSASAEKALQCSYYGFSRRGQFLTNLFMALIIALPYLIIYIVKILIFTPFPLPFMLIKLAAFLLSISSMSIVMAYRWLLPVWTGIAVSLICLASLCGMIGIAIGSWGIFLPLLSTCICLWIILWELKASNNSQYY